VKSGDRQSRFLVRIVGAAIAGAAAATIVLIPQFAANNEQRSGRTAGQSSDPRAEIARKTVRLAVLVERRTLDIGVPATRQPTAAEIERYRDRSRAALSEYFEGRELEMQLEAMERVAVAVTDPTFRSTGGGADTFAFSSTEALAGGVYRVKGSMRDWASMAQVQEGGKLVEARPIGFTDFTIDVRVPPNASHGKVIKYAWDFQPGSGP
jgi:hypothetical protein